MSCEIAAAVATVSQQNPEKPIKHPANCAFALKRNRNVPPEDSIEISREGNIRCQQESLADFVKGCLLSWPLVVCSFAGALLPHNATEPQIIANPADLATAVWNRGQGNDRTSFARRPYPGAAAERGPGWVPIPHTYPPELRDRPVRGGQGPPVNPMPKIGPSRPLVSVPVIRARVADGRRRLFRSSKCLRLRLRKQHSLDGCMTGS